METFVFNADEIESGLGCLNAKGIKEFTLQDEKILCRKGRLLAFLKDFEKKCPGVFLTLPVDSSVLDIDVCKACSRIFCSLELPLEGESRGKTYLFDKKMFSRRARMLNTLGLTFGFSLTFARLDGDGIRLFFDRLNFALSLYPNHIDFPQIEENPAAQLSAPKNSATFSSQDILRSKDCARAAEIFYSGGRAVPWFLSVLAPLKIAPSKFFEDFAAWLKKNHPNAWKNSAALREEQIQIEKMQLSFLKLKYDEKNKAPLFEVVKNIVSLNGAVSRAYGENQESEVEMTYNPDEILSGAASDVQSFFENSFMELSRVKVFMGNDGVEYRYC